MTRKTRASGRIHRRGGLGMALCQMPAAAGGLGLLLVLLTPLGAWEPVAVLGWIGVGVVLSARGPERAVLRLSCRLGPLASGELAVIAEPWAAACEAAGIEPSEVDLYVRTSPEVNAFAIGRRGLVVTSEALLEIVAQRITADPFAAVLLHELGHLRHGDTRFGLALTWLAAPWRLTAGVVLRFCAGRQRSAIALGILVAAAVGIAVVQSAGRGEWPTAAFLVFLTVCGAVVPVLDAHVARRCEYAADRFAAECGYGSALIEALGMLDARPTSRRATSRHPSTYKRRARLLACGDDIRLAGS